MTVAEMVEIGRRAELRGLASVHCVEAARDALIPAAAIACATERIEIGPYIMNAYGRTPWLAALSLADLDELSGGRLMIGIGVGNRTINEAWQGVDVDRPARKMDEYVRLLRMILEARVGQKRSFEGSFHRMTDWSPAFDPLRRSIPIYLAAIFPPMRKVAGRVADGAALGVLCSPTYTREVLRPDIQAAAEEAGRDRGSVPLVAAAFMALDDDRQTARDAIRNAIRNLFAPLPHPYYSFLMSEQGYASVVEDVSRHVAEGRPEQAAASIPDELVDDLAVAGTLEDCRQKLAEFEGIVERVLFVNASAQAAPTGSIDQVAHYDALMGCAA